MPLPRPKGVLNEAVSVIYATRTKADHNEAIVPPGQLGKIFAQEEIRWSADAIPIRCHGTKDLTTATKRVGVKRIEAACDNGARTKGGRWHFPIVHQAPSSASLIGTVVYDHRKNVNSPPPDSDDERSTSRMDHYYVTPPLDGEDKVWLEEAQYVMTYVKNRGTNVGVSSLSQTFAPTDSMSSQFPHSYSEGGRSSNKAQISKIAASKATQKGKQFVGSVQDRSRDAFRQLVTKFLSELSLGIRHLGASLVSKNIIKSADLASKEKLIVSHTEQFTSDEQNSAKTLLPVKSPSNLYTAAFMTYRAHKFPENAISLYVSDRKKPSSQIISLDVAQTSTTAEFVDSFEEFAAQSEQFDPKKMEDATVLEGSQKLMFGISQNVMNIVPRRWLANAEAVWRQWFKLRVALEISEAREDLWDLQEARRRGPWMPTLLDPVHLEDHDHIFNERLTNWWYQTIYLRLPRIWRGHAMTSAYKFIVKNGGASDAIVPVNVPDFDIKRAQSSEFEGETMCPTLAICGIMVRHNPDVPILLTEFVELLSVLISVDDGVTPMPQAKCLVTPSALHLNTGIFRIRTSAIKSKSEAVARSRNPTVRERAKLIWNQSAKSAIWQRALRTTDSLPKKQGIASIPTPPRDERVNQPREYIPTRIETIIPTCEAVDAYITSTSAAVSALFIILYLVRSSCMLEILNLWNECDSKQIPISVESMSSMVQNRWFGIPYATYLKSEPSGVDLKDSDEESFAADSFTETREYIVGRVLGHLPDNICWPDHVPGPTNKPDPSACSDVQSTCFGYDSLFLQAALPFGGAIQVLWELSMKLKNIRRIPYCEAVSNCVAAAQLAYKAWHDLVLVGRLSGLKLIEVGERNLFRLAVGDLIGDPHTMSRFRRKWDASFASK